MAHELDPRRGVARSITRAYRKTLKKAHRVLAEPGASDDPVHDGHTGVKKARMLLRLVKRDLGGARFRRENGALRDAGHALSAVRDAAILTEVINGLLEHASEEDRSQLAPLRDAMAARREEGATRSRDAMAEAARVLEGAEERAGDLTPAHRGWKAIAPGLSRTYGRARERRDCAVTTGRDEAWHALRKSVKDLGYQARFLRPSAEGPLRVEEDRLKQLGSLLGDDHDLVVLSGVAWRPEEHADPAAIERLRALAASRQGELRKEAQAIAEQVFAEAPEARLARLTAAYREARAGARVQRAA